MAPLALVAIATRDRSASGGVLPARGWKPAPGTRPRVTPAPVIVTGRPMSSSRPVPPWTFANCGVPYQLVVQAVAGLASIARDASCGLSPSAVPSGPNAPTLTGASAGPGPGAGAEAAEPAGWLGPVRPDAPRTGTRPETSP